MKSIFAALISLTAAQSFSRWQQMGVFIEKNFDWANVDANLKQAVDNGYNAIYVGFYMSKYGCTGACSAWQSLSSTAKSDVISYVHNAGGKIILSVGGPGEFVEGVIQDGQAASFGASAAAFASANGFDGIDYYTHLAGEKTTPSPWSNNGSLATYQTTLVNQAYSAGWTGQQLSITSNAPYFSPDFIQNTTSLKQQYALSWFALNSNSKENFYVERINLVMFNEENDYMTYDDVMIHNTFSDSYYGVVPTASSVKEIVALGITASNVSIVKPLSPTETSVKTGQGYIAPATLGSWGCQCYADNGWTGGFVGWTWNSYDSYNTLNFPSLIGTC